MPKRDDSLVGAPNWFELTTSDQAGARGFYGQLFGWDSTDPNEEMGGYLNFSKDGELIAGCMVNMPEMSTPDVWSVYFNVTDSEAVAKAVEAHGGTAIVPPMAVADLGTMAVYSDPGGAAFGTWEPGTHRGIGTVGEPGTPSWFELHTRDYDRSLDFYKDVLGWETTVAGDTPDFRYTMAGPADEEYLGVMDASNFLPEGVSSYWAVYVQVDDVDATVARAVELGGAVVQQAEDTPYGRLATISDPTGAAIKLRGPNVSEPQAGAE
jgi:uncharacterized protein